MLLTINKDLPSPKNLPVVTQAELNEALDRHAMFLRGQTGGQRVILQYKDLSHLDFYDRDLSHADFTGSMLAHTDLSLGIYKCACFFACDMTNADLSHSDFSRSDLRGSYLAGANMSGTDLTDADLREGKIMEDDAEGGLVNRLRTGGEGTKTILTGARLTNANLSNVRAHSADFTDVDLSGADISDAHFSQSIFQGANLTNTDFTGTDLSQTNMNDAILLGTIMKDTERQGLKNANAITDKTLGEKIEDNEETLEELLKEHSIWIKTAGKEGRQLNLSHYDLRSATDLNLLPLTAIRATDACFLGIDLCHASMQSTTLDRSDFRDCYMENVDLRGSSLIKVKMTRVILRGARLSPLQFGDEEKNSARLHRVDLSGSDLRFANLQDIDLRDAILMGVDFTHADLTGADLRRADLTGAILKNACLDGANLKDAIIDLDSV